MAIFWADGPVAAPFLQVGVGALGVRVFSLPETVIRVVSAVLHCFGVLQAVRRRHFQVVTASLVRGFAVARQGLQSLKSVALVFQHLASFVDHYLSECNRVGVVLGIFYTGRWSASSPHARLQKPIESAEVGMMLTEMDKAMTLSKFCVSEGIASCISCVDSRQ